MHRQKCCCMLRSCMGAPHVAVGTSFILRAVLLSCLFTCTCPRAADQAWSCRTAAYALCLNTFPVLTIRRYVPTGPGGASLLNKPAPAERRFEGLLIGPNSLPSSPLQHLQICSECYNMEAARMASGQKSRLPGGLTLTDLVQTVSTCHCMAEWAALPCSCAVAAYVGRQLAAGRQNAYCSGISCCCSSLSSHFTHSGHSLAG
jgi:hypothetical protein